MLNIGVQLPVQIPDVGETLADARALEAAGVDSIWIDRRCQQDPWLLLASIATLTSRVRLAVPVSVPDTSLPEAFARKLATLDQLSRGRAIVKIEAGVPPDSIIELARQVGRVAVVLDAEDETSYAPQARRVDGFAHRGETPQVSEAVFRRIVERRRENGVNSPCELWVHIDLPTGREGWRRALSGCEAAGVSGVIVPFGARLLDMLRRPDEEDDRSDLVVAQG